MLAAQETMDSEDLDDGLSNGLCHGRKEKVECEGFGMPVVPRTTEGAGSYF